MKPYLGSVVDDSNRRVPGKLSLPEFAPANQARVR